MGEGGRVQGKRANRLERHLDGVLGLGVVGHLADSALIDRFVEGGEPGGNLAFAALVERHGPMVLATCRSVLREDQDARDAFQATFLVLARKAGTLHVRGSVGPWLHVVAVRAARTAWANSRRRRCHEQAVAGMTRDRVDPVEGLGPDVEVVHEEIARLPERFRGPIVLCELEGIPLQHAAESLGCAVGTIKSRLSRGRSLLRDRLAARGLDPAHALGIVVSLGRIPVPAEIGADLALAAGLAQARVGLAAGAVPAVAIETATSVLRSLAMIKIKAFFPASVASVLVVAASLAGAMQDAAVGRGDDPLAAKEDVGRRPVEIRRAEAAASTAPVVTTTAPGAEEFGGAEQRPSRNQAREDMARLQGVWIRVASQIDGMSSSSGGGGWTATYEGDLMSLDCEGRHHVTAVVTLDPRQSPKAMNSWDLDGRGADAIYPGIYEIEGDTLKVCFARPGKKRPKSFGSPPPDREAGLIYYEYRKRP